MPPEKILIVANQSSVHTAGWCKLAAQTDFDFSVFCLHYGAPVAPPARFQYFYPFHYLRMSEGFKPAANNHAIWPLPFLPFFARAMNGIKTMLLGRRAYKTSFGHNACALNTLIDRIKPDIVHSMDFQQAGYLVARAKTAYKGKFPTWIATNWGSDIYYFNQFADHKPEIAKVLDGADYYSCECERDVCLARDTGYKGRVLPVFPNSGGYDTAAIEPRRNAIKPSDRRIILVKGYQHFAGRALTALDALARIADQLHGYKVVVFSGFTADVVARVNQLSQDGVMDIECLPYSSKDAMMDYFARARVYLGVSISDAISTSLLESIVHGTFPIQTDTSCANEWIIDGETGFIIPPDDVTYIAAKVADALVNDALVDEAAAKNWVTAVERLDMTVLRAKIDAFYKQALTGDTL